MSDNPFVIQRSGSSGASGGLTSRYCKDPRELPLYVPPEGQLYLKTGQGASTTCSAANASVFFTAMALRGAQAAITVADTFVTCANLVGRGRLYSVIAPSYDAGLHKPTIRLTVDGVVYTISPSVTLAAARRLCLGAFTPSSPTVSGTGTYLQSDFQLPNSYADAGFCVAMNGGAYDTNGNMTVVVPEWVETFGMPFLQFESSCLIEFKNSLLATAAGDKIGGAAYRMLPT